MEHISNIFVFDFSGTTFSFYRSAWIGRTFSYFKKHEKGLGLGDDQMEDVWNVMFPKQVMNDEDAPVVSKNKK